MYAAIRFIRQAFEAIRKPTCDGKVCKRMKNGLKQCKDVCCRQAFYGNIPYEVKL
jgi:hypothetical protein